MDTLEDFIQKYKNTFVFLKYKNTQILTTFMDTQGDNLIFKSPDLGTIVLKNENAQNTIVTTFPKTGMYNINGHLCLFYRIPERQYKRSPCDKNSAIRTIIGNARQRIDYDTIEQCFFPMFPKSKAEAITLVNKVGAIALNRNFAVSLADIGDYDLWYKGYIIGSITNDVVDVEYEPLLQETQDYFGGLVWTS